MKQIPMTSLSEHWRTPEAWRTNNVLTYDSYRYGQPGKVDHPTQKPIDMIQKLMALSSADNALILDPFMGSGTTLVAAKNLGRKAIGIEIEERYCKIAAKRLGNYILDSLGGMNANRFDLLQ